MVDKHIVDIIPLTPLPLNRQQFYSYLSDRNISAGTLVSIPFYHRIINGIVIKNRSDFDRLNNIRLKNINKVLEENFLDQNQLELARFVSDYYFSPLGTVLKLFIPKRVQERKSNEPLNSEHDFPQKLKLTDEQIKAINKISKNNRRGNRSPKYLLFGPASSGKTEVYLHTIAKLKIKDHNLQFLILLPELTLTSQAIERYSRHFNPKEIVVVHSRISKGRFYTNWKKIRSGEAKIIIGSRMAVFAPFKNLGLAVIDEEQDISFKQWDMNPRYDSRKVAEKLAELHHCPIIFGSATPDIEHFYRARLNNYVLLSMPKLKNAPTSDIEIVDMKKERWKKNYSVISKKLKSEIEWTLKNKMQVLLFVNRQGISSFSICDACKNILRCPDCDRALVYTTEGIYRCLHCSYKTDIFPKCQNCSGNIFKNIGIGTQKVEKEILSSFSKALVKRIDTEAIRKTKIQESIYRDFSQRKIDILIGTRMITKGWDLPNLGLIGIIDADDLLKIPDFKTDEKAFQNIVQIAGRIGRMGSRFSGKAIIQTFNPENSVITLAAKMDYLSFYEKEIEERKTLSYPPFSRLIKLIFQNESKQKTERETEKIYDSLLKFYRKYPNIKISPPQNPLVPKIRGRYRKQIIIKNLKETLPQELKKILQNLPFGYIMDIDPISIA